jgi:polyvinyl alcohol dehydrogenase (cytochrome)
MKKILIVFGGVLGICLPADDAALAQTPSRVIREFGERCLTCHRPVGSQRAPQVEGAPDEATLRKLTPAAIYRALTAGSMRFQVEGLSEADTRHMAEYIGGRKIGTADAADAKLMPNHCAGNPPMAALSDGPVWNGWGGDLTNARFQPANDAGLAVDQVPRLTLKWAFGFPGATSVYGQPTVAAGRVFVGVDTGYVYSLDAATGCVYWSFRADSGVRTAINVGPAAQSGARQAIYFGDLRANVYALDAESGALLWNVSVDDHPVAVITGAPTLHGDRLYVPLSSREEAVGMSLSYECCTFRGSIVALDTATGRQVWKTFIIPESPKPTRKNSQGVQQWAPAGGAVWSAPTIDPTRRALYVATGDSYTAPAPETTDAVMALDLDTGRVLWVAQDLPNDAWLVGCDTDDRTENCPEDVGPDYDFGASPILRALADGRRILVAGQKSGEVYAHDPDRKGAVVWKATLVSELARGVITFGGAADEQTAYFGLRTGGIAAVRLTTGERKWFTSLPYDPNLPDGQRRGHTAAVTVIPGVVFSGGWDGVLRALSSDDGHVLWEYSMLQSFTTVNAVAARGGSMGAPGPTVAGGMLFAGSGYVGLQNGAPGNVLLAFSVESLRSERSPR